MALSNTGFRTSVLRVSVLQWSHISISFRNDAYLSLLLTVDLPPLMGWM